VTAGADVTAPPARGARCRADSAVPVPPGKSLPPPLPLLEQGVWYGRTGFRFCRLAVLAHTAALTPATRAGGNSFQYRYGARAPGAADYRPVAFAPRATAWVCPVSAMPRLANVRFVANLAPLSLSFRTMDPTRRHGPNADGERPPFFL